MKREIKFRAWQTEDYPIPDERCKMIQHDSLSVDGALDGVKHGNVILMQYTGLNDKNGVEIYEGDILRLHEYEGVEAPVVFHNGAFCIKGFNWDVRKCEVIGNIYEHQNLLQP